MSPEPQLVTKGQRTAHRILMAAAHCIATIGVEKASVTAIASEAGVSRSLVAHHFPKKSEIFMKVILSIAREGYESIDAPPDRANAAEKIRHNYRENLAFFLGNPDYFKCFFLLYYFAAIDRKFRELNTHFTQKAVDRMSGLLAELAAERDFTPAENDLIVWATSLHLELIGAIQRFYIIEHRQKRADFTTEVLKGLDQRLNGFMPPQAPRKDAR